MSDDNEIHYEAHQKINEILLKLQELEADGRAEWKSFIPKLTELKDSRQSHTNMIGTQMDRLTDIKEVLRLIISLTIPNHLKQEILDKLDVVGSARQTERHTDCCNCYNNTCKEEPCNSCHDWSEWKPETEKKEEINDPCQPCEHLDITCHDCEVYPFRDSGGEKTEKGVPVASTLSDEKVKGILISDSKLPEDDKENVMFATFDKRTHVVAKREDLQRWKNIMRVERRIKEEKYIKEEYGIE